MAEQTTNFGLKKPVPDDFYNVDDQNGNMDILDTELKKAQDKADEAFQSASNGKTAIKAAITGVDPDVTIPTDATFQQLATAIGQIETGYDTADATAIAGDILAPKSAYIPIGKVTGTMPNRGAISQSLGINGTYTIPAGYHNGSGKVTQSIPAKAMATYQPSTSAQKISAGQYLSGDQTIAATTGTAGAGDVLPGKTFNSANGIGLTGNMPVLNPDYNDQITAQSLNVGAYSGDGKNYAYMYYPFSGKYNAGANWLRSYQPYLASQYIVPWATIFGIPGNAPVKNFASGTVYGTGYGLFAFADGSGSTYYNFATVGGLTFKPILIVLISKNSLMATVLDTFSSYQYNPCYKMFASSPAKNIKADTLNAYVNTTGFQAPVFGSNVDEYLWIAVG